MTRWMVPAWVIAPMLGVLIGWYAPLVPVRAGSWATPPAAAAADRPGADDQEETGYWLNTATNVRHNRTCRWYKNTKHGRFCKATDGVACKICGG